MSGPRVPFLLLLLLALAAPSQSDPTTLYPDFVLNPDWEDPASEREETIEEIIRDLDEDLAAIIEEAMEESPEETAPPPPVNPADREMRRAQVLTMDLVSSGTWLGTRDRLDAHIEEMRLALVSDAPVNEFNDIATEFLVSLDVLAEMAPMQAPYQADGIEFQRDRMEQQVLFMVQDYSQGEFRRVASTNRLLTRAMGEMHTLLARSDIDRGWDAVDYTQLPGGWEPGNFSRPEFGRQIRSWSGRRLISEYRNRYIRLNDAFRQRNIDQQAWVTLEMGELARELARRTDEVPTLSREPFRNSALKLDVIAENLHDQIVDSRRLHVRRQLISMNQAIRDAERYLELIP